MTRLYNAVKGCKVLATRGMVAVQWHDNGAYELWYRHCDTYPLGLGVEIVQELKRLQMKSRFEKVKSEDITDMLKALGCKREREVVGKPEDAFLRVQGDLDYIHVLELDLDRFELTYYRILQTSNPYFQADFVYPIYGSYIAYMPEMEQIHHRLREVSSIGTTVLRALVSFAKATKSESLHSFVVV